MSLIAKPKNEWLDSTLNQCREADKKLQTYKDGLATVREKTLLILKRVDKKK
jgi:hypothetical protein